MDVPGYLEKHYWWAYVRPWAVRFFDRPWLINLILYGNYARLRDAVVAEFANPPHGRTLKISCCYGSLTPTLAANTPGGLVVIDVLSVQLENARRKLVGHEVELVQMNAVELAFPDASFDRVVFFFLLHELPQDYRERAMSEALRVLAPGGKLIIADFGKPAPWNVFFRFFWLPLLGILEPFAIPLWRQELADIVPHMKALTWRQKKYFGGLFQKLVGTK